MAIPTLPSDILTDILSRLQSKTLIRFKSVSKQWYSLINSPDFINLHLSRTLISDNYPNLVLCKTSLFSTPISDNYNNPIFHFSKLGHPLKHHFHQILGSINGVLCISLYHHPSVVLCNPSTKTHRLVPPFSPSPDTNPQSQKMVVEKISNIVVFGLGFDSVRRDYKLVRMIDTRNDGVPVYRESSVYSLKNDSWKCVNDQTLLGQCFNLRKDTSVFVNEVLHFIVVDITDFKLKVKCFNLQTEIFSIFDLPMVLGDMSFNIKSCVRELGGCFSVLVNYQNIYNLLLERADLWVMKEYGNEESWFRLFSISDPSMLYGFSSLRSCVRAVVYSKDKERVLLDFDNDSSFCWYSWGNNKFERVKVHGWPFDDYDDSDEYCFGWTFLESLVSLGKDKDESEARIVPKKN